MAVTLRMDDERIRERARELLHTELGYYVPSQIIEQVLPKFLAFALSERDAATEQAGDLAKRAKALLDDAEAYIRGYGVGSDSRKLANAAYIVRRLTGVDEEPAIRARVAAQPAKGEREP